MARNRSRVDHPGTEYEMAVAQVERLAARSNPEGRNDHMLQQLDHEKICILRDHAIALQAELHLSDEDLANVFGLSIGGLKFLLHAAASNPRQDEILGLSGHRARVLWPKFDNGGGVNSGSLSAADGRARVRGSLFTREINFLSNGRKRNPKQDEILGLSGYKARVLYPKFEDGGGVNSGSLDAADGRARVRGSLFTRDINFLSNKKGAKAKKNAYEYTGRGALNNPSQDEILGISGYHARVLWPKFSLTGGVNSGNADYIPTSTRGSLFNREINFLSNPDDDAPAERRGQAMGPKDWGPAGKITIMATHRWGKKRERTVSQVLGMPTMFNRETVEEARRVYKAAGGKVNANPSRNPSKEEQAKALAHEIKRVWPKISPHAAEPLFIMMHPEYIMGGDRIEHVIASFLANATGWRGDDARRIKAELNKLLR